MQLLTRSAKVVKGEKLGYLTGVLYLIPADLHGLGKTLCPFASMGCKATCLVVSGHSMRNYVARPLLSNGLPDNAVIRAWQEKTRLYFEERDAFMDQLNKEIMALARTADRRGMRAVLRINGTSDLPWWRWKIIDQVTKLVEAGDLITYDYTKTPAYLTQAPDFHDLTFSRNEVNEKYVRDVLQSNGKVAVVFHPEIPSEWCGYPVINGDEHDLTFLHQGPVILGLKAKGRAKKDETGFVVGMS